MEEGEEGVETQDQGLAQATAASESRDATEKDGAGNQDSEEQNHEEEEDQTGNSWGHAKLPGDVYDSSPFLKSGRNKQDVMWDDVKFLKKHTAQGTTVTYLLEADVLKLYRQVLSEEEVLVKTGGQAQFGYRPRMVLTNIDSMNAESFCERTLSCASLIVTDFHTNLSREEVRMFTILRMNVSLMEYMRGEYDNLCSKIQTSETRITKELRDKAEKQAREASTMDET
jgi:hypothetical protein